MLTYTLHQGRRSCSINPVAASPEPAAVTASRSICHPQIVNPSDISRSHDQKQSFPAPGSRNGKLAGWWRGSRGSRWGRRLPGHDAPATHLAAERTLGTTSGSGRTATEPACSGRSEVCQAGGVVLHSEGARAGVRDANRAIQSCSLRGALAGCRPVLRDWGRPRRAIEQPIAARTGGGRYRSRVGSLRPSECRACDEGSGRIAGESRADSLRRSLWRTCRRRRRLASRPGSQGRGQATATGRRLFPFPGGRPGTARSQPECCHQALSRCRNPH